MSARVLAMAGQRCFSHSFHCGHGDDPTIFGGCVRSSASGGSARTCVAVAELRVVWLRREPLDIQREGGWPVLLGERVSEQQLVQLCRSAEGGISTSWRLQRRGTTTQDALSCKVPHPAANDGKPRYPRRSHDQRGQGSRRSEPAWAAGKRSPHDSGQHRALVPAASA